MALEGFSQEVVDQAELEVMGATEKIADMIRVMRGAVHCVEAAGQQKVSRVELVATFTRHVNRMAQTRDTAATLAGVAILLLMEAQDS